MRSSGEAWGASNKKQSMSVSVEKSRDKGLGLQRQQLGDGK